MKRRRLNAVKKGGAAARVPEFDEDSESDYEKKFEPKTSSISARPRTMCTKTIKPMTSSNTNADASRVADIDEASCSDDHHSPSPNKPDATQKHAEKQSVERTLARKKEQSAIRNGSSQSQIKLDNMATNSNGGEQQKHSQPEAGRKNSDPRKALSETSNRTVTRPTANATIVIGPFSGEGLDPSTLVGLHIKKTNIRGCALEKSHDYCLYPTLKLVEGAEEVHFTIDCERHDARYHGFEMDRKLSDALREIVEEKPVKIAEAVAGTCWRFTPKPVRKGYGEHIYKAVGLRLEGMDDIGWIWGRESKNGGTIFSYCDVNVMISPRWQIV